jgi:hypothetical protein
MSDRGRPKDKAPKGYVTIRKAAEILRVTPQAIRSRKERGTLPFKESLQPNGETRYYIQREAVEQARERRNKASQRSPEDRAVLDQIHERLDELQQTMGEILETTRNRAPLGGSSEQIPTDEDTTQGERNGPRLPYERADVPEFQDLVGRDVRGKSTPEEHSLLRSPENLQLWRDGLRAILSDLETQRIQRKADAEAFRTECFRKGQSGKQEWFDFKAEWDAWKGGASRFTRSVQTSLAEAKRLAQEHQQQDEKERFRQLLVEFLDFLNEDEAITYKYTPNRDTLREKISGALYKSR